MRVFLGSVLFACLLLLGAPAGLAGEGEARHAASGAAEEALGVLKLRMEARIKEGELLAKSGRLEEALVAYRSVGDLYDRGMSEVRTLVASLGRGASAASARLVGVDEPVAGGAFRGRPGPQAVTQEALRERERAVDHALRWLAAHQSPSGGWEAAGFHRWCYGAGAADPKPRPDGQGKAVNDVGVTGLALLAFLGAGYTHRGQHPHREVVSKGLRYLKNVQDAEGCFGARTSKQFIYGHGTAALAMIENYGMTGSPVFKGSAQRALDFVAAARNPYLAWRYGVRPGDNDTSVTAWMVMCLKSATLINHNAVKRGKKAPLVVDETGFQGARAWLDKVTDPDYGRVGYIARGSGSARPLALVDRFPSGKSEAMTAAGMLMRVFLGEDPRKSALITKGAHLCSQLPPVWNPADGSIDVLYWYFGTLAMFQVGGKAWRGWAGHLDAAMVRTQRLDTDACGFKGSWDPIGPWGAEGGRVYSTALMCLSLEVLCHYDKVFGTK